MSSTALHQLLRMLNPIIFLSLICLSLALVTPKFRDVTIQAGIDITPRGVRKLLKYGGPTVADLDRDGYYDLILVHHGSNPPEVYFNNRDGTFTKADFGKRRDVHAITAFRLPRIADTFFTIVRGGNRGTRHNPPLVYRVFKNRTIVEENNLGLDHWSGRGRAVIFMPFRKVLAPTDALFLNRDSGSRQCPTCVDGQYDAYSYNNLKQSYQPEILQGLPRSGGNHHALAIDSDGDGQLELLTWRNLSVHRISRYFTVTDVSKRVLGDSAYFSAGAAAVEIDYDNDGDFDLYIATDKNGFRNSTRGTVFSDLLLENRGGKFVNVAVEAGIPRNTISRGVTAGDFNNDGWMDLYVTVLREGKDFMLLNNGDGTFRTHDIGFSRGGAWGDNALAVDYDSDGRVDLIRSEGDWGNFDYGGQFRILRNVLPGRIGRFIKVKVGRIEDQTGQHAVVTLFVVGTRMMQRVGQAGVQTPHSYLDTLHFGIGGAKDALVQVRWLNGVISLRRANAGETVSFGSFE